MQNSSSVQSIDFIEKSGRKVADKELRGVKTFGLREWKAKVKASTEAYSGGVSSEYGIRVQFDGRRKYVPLGTSDLAEAAKRAQALFFDLKSLGWEAAILKLNPSAPARRTGELTLGDYLTAVKAIWKGDELTFRDYAAKTRTLTARVLGIKGEPSDKWCGAKPQVTPWQLKLNAINLNEITPEKITNFMKTCAEAKYSDQREKNAAKHTVNSLVRNARALFSRKKLVPNLRISLPQVLPFDGVKLLKEENGEFRFLREIDPNWLVQEAINELSLGRPRLFAIFLLALGAGLRRNEIDKLRWRELLQASNLVEVARTPVFKPKSYSSLRKIKMPASFYAALQSMRGNHDLDDFVISSTRAAKLDVNSRSYRCADDFAELSTWLELKGIKREPKKIHSLRKYFGDTICNSFGIYKAAHALGHSKISTTEMFYAAPPDVEAAPFSLS